MTTVSQGNALLAIALLGALVQVAIALRLYEPPPPEGGEPPLPVLEAVLFGVVFSLVYAALGLGLTALEGVAPPYGSLAVLVAAGVGLYSAHATSVGRMGTSENRATRAMGAAAGATTATVALVVLTL